MISVDPNQLKTCKEARHYFTCQRPLHVTWLLDGRKYAETWYDSWYLGILGNRKIMANLWHILLVRLWTSTPLPSTVVLWMSPSKLTVWPMVMTREFNASPQMPSYGTCQARDLCQAGDIWILHIHSLNIILVLDSSGIRVESNPTLLARLGEIHVHGLPGPQAMCQSSLRRGHSDITEMVFFEQSPLWKFLLALQELHSLAGNATVLGFFLTK